MLYFCYFFFIIVVFFLFFLQYLLESSIYKEELYDICGRKHKYVLEEQNDYTQKSI